jgi:alanine racemase
MAMRLTVQRVAWETHVRAVSSSVAGLVPVVKGNGYGFGRKALHAMAAGMADHVSVGTIYELDHVAPGVTPVVLTPSVTPPEETTPILTVGSVADVHRLKGWNGRVLIKLQSSMRRFGATKAELADVATAARSAGMEAVGYSLHLPLAGSDDERVGEVEAWLSLLDPTADVWLSHLRPKVLSALQERHPRHAFRLRLGTALWHGDKSFLQLNADVLAVHRVAAGDRVGYRLTEVAADGDVVLVSAGSSHGVATHSNGLSPFHFARTRLALIETHMHTAMLLATEAQPRPGVGDRVDVQWPIISTHVDEIEWV